jgi:predicted transcriptional regulator
MSTVKKTLASLLGAAKVNRHRTTYKTTKEGQRTDILKSYMTMIKLLNLQPKLHYGVTLIYI